jgi:phage FluMu gp28-like protein
MGRGSLPTAALIIVFRHGDATRGESNDTQTRRIFGIRNLHNGEENLRSLLQVRNTDSNFSLEVEIARKQIISSFLGLPKNGHFRFVL